ncbi:MAG: ESX secretion-associated protein EspG [Pseudonocardiales bacterium]|nr:ESX secretion-associated protein EspG [Pseudonocardiales bacterium]
MSAGPVASATSGALELTTEEYLLAWRHLRLGLVHWNLRPPGGSERTAEEHTAAQRRAWEALRARGLAGTRQLAPELEDALHLIARPAAELNARLDLPDGKRTVVGCARGEHAALAELGEFGMRIRAARDTALPTAVADVIPDRLPLAEPATRTMGSGTAVSVPAELLADQEGMTGVEVERALLRGGTRPDDAHRFRTMLQGPKLGGGKFGAARRDRRGGRRVAEFVVTYYETERGGYTLEQKRGVDRSRWYTLASASRPQLAQRLAHLLNSIRI